MDTRIIIDKIKKGQGFIYTLQCINEKCSKIFKLHGYKFNSGKGKYCCLKCANTCPKHEKNMNDKRPSQKGKLNSNYKNGWTMYQQKRKSFCELCGVNRKELKGKKEYKREPLEVHHKDENRENGNCLNLITVCSSCHKLIHNHGKRRRDKSGKFTSQVVK